MSHMVIFRTPEGKPGYQPADTVEEAVEVVERLRNEDGVENVRIFRLEELTFEYKPYYRVELTDGASSEPRSRPTAVFSVPSGDDASAVAYADEPGDGLGDSDDGDEDSSEDETSSAVSESQPSWAAPPPPPPVLDEPGEIDAFGDDEPTDGNEASDDEYSGSGQRRGLFGR